MSSRGQLPEGTDPDEVPWWPADGPWGGRGRTSVLLVVGGLVVVALVVILAVTFLTGDESGSGSAAVAGPPAPVLASEGLQPTTRVMVGGAPYDVGVGAFTPSARAAPTGSHLLLAPIVVRNGRTRSGREPAGRVGGPARGGGPALAATVGAERPVGAAVPQRPARLPARVRIAGVPWSRAGVVRARRSGGAVRCGRPDPGSRRPGAGRPALLAGARHRDRRGAVGLGGDDAGTAGPVRPRQPLR